MAVRWAGNVRAVNLCRSEVVGLTSASESETQAMTAEMRALLVGMLAIARYPSKGWRVLLLEAGWTSGKVRGIR
jgi:hypothetical protein